MNKINFNANVLFLGFGAVAQCVLPLFVKHFQIDLSQITILDALDNRHLIPEDLQKINYVQAEITQENMSSVLGKYVKKGGLIIDLAFDIDCLEILQWCHDQEVLYLNTSVELWNPYLDHDKNPTVRTLYVRHQALQKMLKTWNKKGSTAVLEHGANPGLVSHFVKVALKDMVERFPKDFPTEKEKINQLQKALEEKNFPLIAKTLEVKVIHISERDTQITNQPKKVNEFVNTWSIDGLYEEGTAPAEMGWGTHEKTLPLNAYTHLEGPQNQICLGSMGMETWAKSLVPSGEIVGMIIRHGEAYTIPKYFTVYEGEKAVYRPTVHYVYCPSDSAIASVHELKMRNLEMQPKKRILSNEILPGGLDEVGVLLMGHPWKSWWTGSVLSIDQTRNLVQNQNATTLQVACSILGAITWMIANPNAGVCVPDELPYDFVLEIAKPYLGNFVSQPYDWTPLKNKADYFEGFRKPNQPLDENDPWQFRNFYFTV